MSIFAESRMTLERRPMPQERPKEKKRVLIVDDEPDTADMLSTLLIAMGYDARAAYDAERAIGMARDFRPLVAVLDIQMPGVDGYQAAERLRAGAGR